MNPVHARTANNACASNMPHSRVFIAGDAVRRHLPSNHLGSNTSIPGASNLPGKLLGRYRGSKPSQDRLKAMPRRKCRSPGGLSRAPIDRLPKSARNSRRSNWPMTRKSSQPESVPGERLLRPVKSGHWSRPRTVHPGVVSSGTYRCGENPLPPRESLFPSQKTVATRCRGTIPAG